MYGEEKKTAASPAATNILQESEARAVARVVETHLKAQLLDVGDGRKVLITPKGVNVSSVKSHLDEYLYAFAPDRRRGTAKLQDLRSFIAHANRFSDDDSALFGDRDVPSLTCVIDYHHPSETVTDDGEVEEDEGARFGTHRGVYLFPVSDEWKAWKAIQGRWMSQVDFAEFIEQRIVDVFSPGDAGLAAAAHAEKLGIKYASPSHLLELSRGLTVHVAHKVTNATRLGTGETSMQFETSHNDAHGAPVKVPGGFLIAIPVFRGGAPYQLPVRLRYRVHDGKITWSVEMHEPERSFDHAFAEACDEAAAQTELPLFMGSPEA